METERVARMGSCKNGHYYDSEKYKSCPYCNDSSNSKMLPCTQGHYYNSEKYKSCPYCNDSSNSRVLHCSQGHHYDSEKYKSCPYCNDSEWLSMTTIDIVETKKYIKKDGFLNQNETNMMRFKKMIIDFIYRR